MKYSTTLYSFLLIFFFTIICSSQKYELTNGKYNEKLTSESVVEIYTTTKTNAKGKCIECSAIEGTIKSITKDSIILNLNSYCTYKKVNKNKSTFKYNATKPSETYAINLKDITSLSVYKSLKAKKRGKIFSSIGGYLSLTSLAALGGSWLFKSKTTQSDLRDASAYGFAVSLTFSFADGQQFFNFKKKKRPWTFKQNPTTAFN